MNTKLMGLMAGTALFFYSFGAYALDNHLEQAIKYTESTVSALDAQSIAERAEVAKSHAIIAKEHLDAGIKNLESAIDHGKQGHADIAKVAAETALTHLKAAR